jgi:hypothetical protein
MSPKMFVALVAVFGFGLAVLATFVVEPQTAIWPTVLLSTIVGAVWGIGLIAISRWRTKSTGSGLSGESFGVFLVFVTLASLLDLAVEAAYALGAYSFVLLVVLKVWEWRYRKPVSWHDLGSQQKHRED